VPIKVDIPHLAFIKGSYSLCLEFIFVSNSYFFFIPANTLITPQIASALFDADQRLTRNTAIRLNVIVCGTGQEGRALVSSVPEKQPNSAK
jgi:hypothetical protein